MIPDSDDHGRDDPGPEPEPGIEPDPDPDDTYNIVFISIIGKNAQDVCSSDGCRHKMCIFLNYGFVRHEQFKDARICTNYRECRKCPKHNCILSYSLPRKY